MTQKNEHSTNVRIGSGNNRFVLLAKKNVKFFKSLPKFVKILVVLIITGVFGIGASYVILSNRKQSSTQQTTDTKQIAQQKLADYIKRQTDSTKVPSAQEQYASTQIQVSTLKDPNDAKQSLQTYVDAAFAAARVNNPTAKEYAAKALSLYPTDKEVRATNAGQISRLEMITKGDYANALR